MSHVHRKGCPHAPGACDICAAYVAGLSVNASIEQVQVLNLTPSDILAVKAYEPVSVEEASRIRDGIAMWAGIEPERVLILSGATLEVLHHDEDLPLEALDD